MRRSRWESGVNDAARQISRMVSGFFSDLMRVRAAFDFSLEERVLVESGFKIDGEKWRRWRKGGVSLVERRGFSLDLQRNEAISLREIQRDSERERERIGGIGF